MWAVSAGVMLVLCVAGGSTSAGDRSYTHYVCMRNCVSSACSTSTEAGWRSRQPVMERLLAWTCEEECGYQCMWSTVRAFQDDRSPVPQFHGKWPFVRVWGIQEPASVLFSVLNGLSHVWMLLSFRRAVPADAPLYWLWHSYAFVCIHAWTWSTIFHTRDKPFTEYMDYFCAVSLVTFSFFTFFVRLLGTQVLWRPVLVFLAFLAFYANHVYYLAFVKFDYGYNMKVNVIMGLGGTICWTIWALRVRSKQPYVYKGMAAHLLMTCVALLELLDFPPLWWLLDAHSLWHAATVPLAFLWYRFIIDDCLYMHNEKQPRIGVKED